MKRHKILPSWCVKCQTYRRCRYLQTKLWIKSQVVLLLLVLTDVMWLKKKKKKKRTSYNTNAAHCPLLVAPKNSPVYDVIFSLTFNHKKNILFIPLFNFEVDKKSKNIFSAKVTEITTLILLGTIWEQSVC